MKFDRLVFAAALLSSSSSFAHIALNDPPNRYASNGNDGKNKECPCGFNAAGTSAGTQTCNNGVTSDAHRSNHVTTFAAGQQITVTWVETVGHSGRMRIAFDNDGADLADFNNHILFDVADPGGSAGKNCTVNSSPTDVTCTASGSSTWTATFHLPNTPCSNCTLQVIQDMSGDTVDPVSDPTGDATYFQCADLVLTGGSGGEGEGEGAAGEGEGAAGEGEGAAGEGEGAAGEGEGAAGEGEGAAGEGEGAAGEGEGAGSEGEGVAAEGEGGAAEGEGEGDAKLVGCAANCNASGDSGALMAFGLVGLALMKRRVRR